MDRRYEQAAEEARRFLVKYKNYDVAVRERADEGKAEWWPMPERAELKRSSLDLTRALARMRRGA